MGEAMKSNIDTVIENLVNLHVEKGSGARQRHLLRESLRALVRLAQSQQIMEIKSSVRKLGGLAPCEAVERAGGNALAQGQLEFEPVSAGLPQDQQDR